MELSALLAGLCGGRWPLREHFPAFRATMTFLRFRNDATAPAAP